MVKFRFKKIETVEDILEAIGRKDIPSNKVVIRRPAIDEETGETVADVEIEFPDEYLLAETDVQKLEVLMIGHGLKLKEKR
ncbi:MAG: hypothetical protein ACTSPB_03620 [Candidatus Thorarchaeota archaeon]